MSEREVWFKYSVTPVRFSAVPVHWKGWASLLVFPLIPLALIVGGFQVLEDQSARLLWSLVVLALFMPLSIIPLIHLVRARGRRV